MKLIMLFIIFNFNFYESQENIKDYFDFIFLQLQNQNKKQFYFQVI